MLTALVVEDSPQMLERIAQEVKDAGMETVITTMTEDDALGWCDRMKINLAIVDLQLAQGTGFGVIRRLKEKGRPACVVAVYTNHAVPALKVAAFEAGADYFFEKEKGIPFLPRLVAEAREGLVASTT